MGLVVALEVFVVQPFIKRPLLYCTLIYRVLEGRVQTRVSEADASRDDHLVEPAKEGEALVHSLYEIDFNEINSTTPSKCVGQLNEA